MIDYTPCRGTQVETRDKRDDLQASMILEGSIALNNIGIDLLRRSHYMAAREVLFEAVALVDIGAEENLFDAEMREARLKVVHAIRNSTQRESIARADLLSVDVQVLSERRLLLDLVVWSTRRLPPGPDREAEARPWPAHFHNHVQLRRGRSLLQPYCLATGREFSNARDGYSIPWFRQLQPLHSHE